MNVRKKNINLLADRVRSKLSLGSPLNVYEAVRRLDGEVKRDVLAQRNADAAIEALAGLDSTGIKFRITLNSSISATEQRIRFSIAHEIGHLFLHMGFIRDETLWNRILMEKQVYIDGAFYRLGYSEEEYEANEFAGSFLMPRDEFIRVANKNLKREGFDLEPIAKYFDVSILAVKMRGRYLDLFSWDD